MYHRDSQILTSLEDNGGRKEEQGEILMKE